MGEAVLTCPCCGTIVIVYGRGAHLRKWCSEECRDAEGGTKSDG